MPLYRVRWEIDLDAETPRDAAEEADDSFRGAYDPCFTVQELDEKKTVVLSETTVDLGVLD